MAWVYVLLLAMIVLEQLVDRKHLARVRQAQRVWRATSTHLSEADRREVKQAVRNGRGVADPDLADAAIDLATSMAAGRVHHPLRWANTVAFIGWQVVIAVLTGLRHTWPLALLVALAPLFFIALAVSAFRYRRRAEEALAANRRLADQLPRRSRR